MKPTIVHKDGLELRAIECPKCKDKIIHPADLNSMAHFKNLKDKTFEVKLRMVGNSHAISIPKEIVEFMNERHREMKSSMDEMVKLCFDDFNKLSVIFDDFDSEDFGRNRFNDDAEDKRINSIRVRRIRRQ